MLLALAIGGARPARAQSAKVDVVVAAAPSSEEQLVLVLTELLARLQVDLELRRETVILPATVVTPPTSPRPALARAFIDATQPNVALLYLVDGPWERVLVRRIALDHGLDEVAREQLAHIVESSIRALAAGGTIGVTRAEASAELGIAPPPTAAPEPPAAPAPLPPAKPRVVVLRTVPQRQTPSVDTRLGLGWGLAAWTPEVAVHGPELGLRFSVGRRLAFGGGLLLQYRLQRRVQSELAGVGIEGVGLRATAHARYRLEPRFALLAAIGGGLDRETFQPRSGADTSVTLGTASMRSSGILTTSFGVELRIAGPLVLLADAGAEVDLAPDDYVVERATQIVTIAEPLRVRPTISLLLAAAL